MGSFSLQDSFGSEVLSHLNRDLVEPKNAVMTTPEKDTKTKIIGVTLLFFLIAGLCEIGGGYLVWLWLRDGMSWMLGALGGFVLFLYGVVPTFQPSHFHRIYAAYGGTFIGMAVVWGWIF